MKICYRQGDVLLHTDDDVHYKDTHANFSADAAELAFLTTLPKGMAAMEYYVAEEILVYYDAKGNAFPREGRTPWPEATAFAAQYGTVAARKQSRLTAEAVVRKAAADAEQVETADRTHAAFLADKMAKNEKVDEDNITMLSELIAAHEARVQQLEGAVAASKLASEEAIALAAQPVVEEK